MSGLSRSTHALPTYPADTVGHVLLAAQREHSAALRAEADRQRLARGAGVPRRRARRRVLQIKTRLRAAALRPVAGATSPAS